MIIDKQRHEVARKLRALACTPDEIGITERAVIRDLGISSGIYDDCCKSEDVLAVADLIDRKTCNDVGDNWKFRCSACGCELDIIEMEVGEPTMWKDGAAQVPKYCPSCGAEVVTTSD